MKKLLIFDMDGVLFDSVTLANNYIKERFPTITDKEHEKILLGNFHEEYEKLKAKYPQNEKTEEEKIARRKAYVEKKSKVPMYFGVKDLLQELHNTGCIITLNTSAYNHTSIPLLEKEGILHLFDFLATADVSKSKVEKFKILEDTYRLYGNDVLFVTDTLGDVREANIAKVQTAAVTWGAHTKNFFTKEHNENLIAIVDTVEELKALIYNA